MKKIRNIVLFIFAGILMTYLIPSPQKSFIQLYDGQDKTLLDSVENFKATPTQTLEFQDNKWQYLITGTGKETLLFLHGMSGTYDIWWQQINAFKSDYRIVSLTYPPVSTLAEMGQAVKEILDKNKIEQVIIVSNSMGGYLTQYLYATYPKRIKKVVFGNTFPPNDIIKKENSTQATLLKVVPEWLMMHLWRKGLQEKIIPAGENNPLLKATLLEMSYGKMSRKQYAARYDCAIDKFKPNNSSSTPILIFESDNDPLVPLVLREALKKLYPTAQVHTFHNKGHFPFINAPTEYNKALKVFLEQ